MKTTRSRKRFKVFEFGESDKRVEKVSKKMLGKYGSSDRSPVAKYRFLQCFAQGTKTKQKDIINEIVVIDASDDAIKEAIPVLDVKAPSGSSNYKPATYHLDSGHSIPELNCYAARAQNCGVISTGSSHVDSTLPQFLSNNEPVTINSDNDDDIELSSSASASDVTENEGPLKEKELEHHVSGCALETTVVVYPDYGPFSFEWAVGDIINIESQWCRGVETAVVNLHLKSKDTKVAENTHTSSGIVELKFAVFDPNWPERQEAIKLLNVRYKTQWNLVSEARNEDGCLRNNNIFVSKQYFSNLGESFEEVIYPKGDPDAVSISKRDIELLQPETFINDTIIDFYIKYLKNKIKPEEKHRFHFFNSFFFRKLADLDKDPSRACKGKAAFQRVRKWTRKVNLFEKDYIFIPVNFSLHWSLIVICHPGDMANTEDEDMEKLPKVPCILHMDSIRGSHRGLKSLFRSYLWEEWKERENQLPEDISPKFLNLQFVPLELPQQENSFDCGLFLLHYVELFLDCAPTDFSPFKIAKFSNFLNKDWFPPAEVSFKRAHIKKLICEIVEDNAEKSAPAPCDDDKYPSAELRGMDESEIGVEFLQDNCSLPEICCDNYSSSIADQKIEIIQLPTPMRGVQGSKEQDSVFREELEPRTAEELCFDGSYQSFGQMLSRYRLQNLMSPIEEGEEAWEQFAYSTTKASAQSLNPEVTESLTPAKELRTLKLSSFPVVSVHLVDDDEDDDSFSGGSAGGSPILLEVRENDDHHPTEEFFGPNRNGEKEKFESPSISSDGLAACVVEDSEDEDGTLDSYETGKSPFRLAACVVEDSEDEDGTFDSYETGKSPFRLGKILCLSNQEANTLENTTGGGNNILPESELLKYPAAKRPRKSAYRKWKTTYEKSFKGSALKYIVVDSVRTGIVSM
ncbi:probable ubiquitin-like-specific protease 2A isoform X2 [Actinidia eriantha]|uniref:probable ubiquitin-like-specific protease 2A isoform X2 n=1 Tax=Actinidia eriantha TaxID=165200 RepID=UPI00258F75C0|nr:probable ubiquitin-like-specific protease 2A isoform X2 [Actinidia eriantha]